MSWTNEDITFCGNNSCPHTKCMRQRVFAPKTHPFSMAVFPRNIDGSCSYRFDIDWESVDPKPLEEKK